MELLRRYTLFVYAIWDFLLGFRLVLWSAPGDRRKTVNSWGALNLIFTSLVMSIFCLVFFIFIGYFSYIMLKNNSETLRHNRTADITLILFIIGIVSFYSGLYLNNIYPTKSSRFRKGIIFNIVGAAMILIAAYLYKHH